MIPLGVGWPLPAYELALMTAWEAHSMGIDDLQLAIYTPESQPLEIFGAAGARALREDLDEVGIRVQLERARHRLAPQGAWSSGRRRPLDAGRIACDEPSGRRCPALPNDERGFMRCDEHGKVLETAAVWAAGDAIASLASRAALPRRSEAGRSRRRGRRIRSRSAPCCAASCSP